MKYNNLYDMSDMNFRKIHIVLKEYFHEVQAAGNFTFDRNQAFCLSIY